MTQQQILTVAVVGSCLALLFQSCVKDPNNALGNTVVLDGAIDTEALNNYANQSIPGYINRDNTRGNDITDEGATLGRVLFYDVNLSTTNTISCASCHKQEFAFGDNNDLSQGANGITGRHSMRLVNARFGNEVRFFWDERAATLEEQTTMPIQDHAEMGFSGQNGDPGMDDLLEKLNGLDYYPALFQSAFGSTQITESRMQLALAQFVRSIQSFDSKYDVGRAQRNDQQPFPNFTAAENAGKNLFLAPPQLNQQGERVGGGAGCARCHQPPEFSIVPNSGNNGVIRTASGDGTDLTITRSPTLRDLVHPTGALNGNMMHTGSFGNLRQMLLHYNAPPPAQGLDNRLRQGPNPQRLNLTATELQQLEAFMRTLTGSAVYDDPRWSNPF